MARDVFSPFFFPFPSARILPAHGSLWAYSPPTDARATEVWAAKLACRNISVKLFGAQHYPGACRSAGERSGHVTPPAATYASVETTRARVSGGRGRQKEGKGGTQTLPNSPARFLERPRTTALINTALGCVETGAEPPIQKTSLSEKKPSRTEFQRKLNRLRNLNASAEGVHCFKKHLQNPLFPLGGYWRPRRRSGGVSDAFK